MPAVYVVLGQKASATCFGQAPLLTHHAGRAGWKNKWCEEAGDGPCPPSPCLFLSSGLDMLFPLQHFSS